MTLFRSDAATYPGQQPDQPAGWNDWSSRRFWIGKPAAMFELPSPSADGYVADPGSGEVEHALYGGGTGVTLYDAATRRWQFTWPRLAPLDWQLVWALYRRRPPFGTGPWLYVGPEDGNRLTAAQSLCGALHGVVEGWAVTAGTLAYQAGIVAPFPGGGVMRWTPGASGKLLIPGTAPSGTPTPDLDYGMPSIPAEYTTAAFWVWTPSGTASVRARIVETADDGTVATTLEGADRTVTTTPRLVYATADPGTFGAGRWLLGQLRSNDGAAVNVANADARYTDGPLDGFEQGTGVPRVTCPAPPGRPVDVNLNSAPTLVLAEAFPGAA